MRPGGPPLYSETSPLRLAAPPERFSHTALRSLRACPRRWQLIRSRWSWGTSYPERPSEAILRGHVVHRALEAMVDRLCAAGAHAFGGAEFVEVGRAFQRERALEKIFYEERAAFLANPRSHGLGEPRVTLAECQNAVVRLLRATWDLGPKQQRPTVPSRRAEAEAATPRKPGRQLDTRLLRAGDRLPEVQLEHPMLPIGGVADLVAVEDDGDVIVDYKTGASRPEHAEQVRLYGLLWWRTTGRLPRLMRVVSSDGGPPTEILGHGDDLCRLEADLAAEVAAWRWSLATGVAPARPAEEACRFCAVRQVCEEYWTSDATSELRWPSACDKAEGLRDVELGITSVRSRSSARGRLASGEELTLVSDAELWPLDGAEARVVRALAVRSDGSGCLASTRWSEVFTLHHLGSERAGTGAPGAQPGLP